MTFDLYSFRFQLSARHRICFPEACAGNVLRGALGSILRRIHCEPQCPARDGGDIRLCAMHGSCRYARIFEPASFTGPSGMSRWPRPFVFRAAHLNGKTIAPDEPFSFDINLFETRNPGAQAFVEAFAQFARLQSVEQIDACGRPTAGTISVPLHPTPEMVRRVRVRFLTPTELKSAHGRQPDFRVLFARAQDRISALRQLYGAGPVTADFKGMRARAAGVRMTRCELQHVAAERRSGRTGQLHGIGGFIGIAEYEGELAEFLPYVEAARWTGVGRQCTWGKGELQVEIV